MNLCQIINIDSESRMKCMKCFQYYNYSSKFRREQLKCQKCNETTFVQSDSATILAVIDSALVELKVFDQVWDSFRDIQTAELRGQFCFAKIERNKDYFVARELELLWPCVSRNKRKSISD